MAVKTEREYTDPYNPTFFFLILIINTTCNLNIKVNGWLGWLVFDNTFNTNKQIKR